MSNAGHLPPLVLGPDSDVQVLDAARADLLLGVDADVLRHEQVLTVPDGSTVLLYTDGLVERRDQLFDEGVAQLREELAALGNAPMGQVADQLLARMLPQRVEDDVALIAVRLHPRDRPA